MDRLPTCEAIARQLELRERVLETPLDLTAVRTVAGCDCSAGPRSSRVFVAVVVVELPSLRVIDQAACEQPASYPYLPGLLAFRELPPLLAAWEQLQVRPDVLVCDGHGRAHPRRCGLACHAGVTLDLPAIGCGKSRLCGVEQPLGAAPGDTAELHDGDELIGRLLRTRRGSKPLYVSIGHRVTLADAVALVRACLAGRRLPEPTRLAHELVNRARRAAPAR